MIFTYDVTTREVLRPFLEIRKEAQRIKRLSKILCVRKSVVR